jgi:hypothetical protein
VIEHRADQYLGGDRRAVPALVPATMMSARSMPSVGVVGDQLEAEA